MPDQIATVSPLPPATWTKDFGVGYNFTRSAPVSSKGPRVVGPLSYTIPPNTASIIGMRVQGNLEFKNADTSQQPYHLIIQVKLQVDGDTGAAGDAFCAVVDAFFPIGHHFLNFDIVFASSGTLNCGYSGSGSAVGPWTPGDHTTYMIAGGITDEPFTPGQSALLTISHWDITCRTSAVVPVYSRVCATVPLDESCISVAFQNGTNYISRSNLSPQSCGDWTSPITIEGGHVGQEGILYMTSARLVSVYEKITPVYRTSDDRGIGNWSGTQSLIDAGCDASGVSDKGAFRFIAGPRPSTDGLRFLQKFNRSGEDVWFGALAVDPSVVPSLFIQHYCGGVDMGNAFGVLYTRPSDHHIFWLKTEFGNDWLTPGPAVDTGMVGIIVALARHRSAALVGLVWQVVDHTCVACRSFNGGDHWEVDTDPIPVIPALPYPPWLVCRHGIFYAVWTTSDTPDMAYSEDTGLTWQACAGSSPSPVALEVEAVRTTTTDTTLSDPDRWLFVDATSNNVTVTLPLSTTIAHFFGVKRIDGSGHTVSVVRSGSDTLDGATSKALTTQWEAYQFVPNGVSLWGIF